MAVEIMAVESIRGDEYFTLDPDAETIAQHIIRPMKVWLPFNDAGGRSRGCFLATVTR